MENSRLLFRNLAICSVVGCFRSAQIIKAWLTGLAGEENNTICLMKAKVYSWPGISLHVLSMFLHGFILKRFMHTSNFVAVDDCRLDV